MCRLVAKTCGSVLCAVLCVAALASATKIDRTLTLEPRVGGASFATFTYGNNGSFSFTLHNITTRDTATKATVAVFRTRDWLYSNPCWSPDVMDEALVRIPLNQTTVPFTVTTPVFKSSVVATIMLCDTHATTTFSFVAELKNGNSHLSTDDAPQPVLYIVVTALWGIFFIAWFLNFVIIRHVVKLHISISVFIVIKLVSVIYLMLYWLEMDKIGTVDASVVFGYYAVKIIEMCAFFSVLLLIGAGWGMIDNNRARKWPLIAGLVILYGLFFGLSLFFWWFGVAAVLLLCVTLYVVYVMSMQSTQILSLKVVDFAAKIDTAKAHGSSDTEPGMNVPLLTSEMEHLQRQMVMLMRFRFIIMAYIVGQLVVSIILLFVSLSWVDSLLSEVLDVFLFVCIGWVFRLRPAKKDGMYFLLENEFDEYSTPMDQLPQPTAPPADDSASNEAAADSV